MNEQTRTYALLYADGRTARTFKRTNSHDRLLTLTDSGSVDHVPLSEVRGISSPHQW